MLEKAFAWLQNEWTVAYSYKAFEIHRLIPKWSYKLTHCITAACLAKNNSLAFYVLQVPVGALDLWKVGLEKGLEVDTSLSLKGMRFRLWHFIQYTLGSWSNNWSTWPKYDIFNSWELHSCLLQDTIFTWCIHHNISCLVSLNELDISQRPL
jgi:hypothetical protein